MKTDTPTPETNQATGNDGIVVLAEFARKLERQRDFAMDALIELRDAPWLNLPGRAGDLIESTIDTVKGDA